MRHEHDFDNGVPGVGRYEEHADELKGVGFAKSQRVSHKVNTNPGPGQYSSEKVETSKVISFDKHSPKFPYSYYQHEQGKAGPGDYHTDKSHIKGIALDKSQRSKFKKNDNPGPGHYHQEVQAEISKNIILKTQGKFPYSYYTKQQGQSGPGDYHSEQVEEKGFHMGKAKRSSRHISETPGPGHYEQDVQQTKKVER